MEQTTKPQRAVTHRNFEAILESAGFDRNELNSLVADHARWSEARETVFAYELPVAELATAVYELAHRLAVIESLAAPVSDRVGQAGALAEAICAQIEAVPAIDPLRIVAGHLGVPITEDIRVGALSAELVYGHPHLREVTWFRHRLVWSEDGSGRALDIQRRRFHVDTRTGTLTDLDQTPEGNQP